jgi:nitrite reductase/ring-hydroxylating ferredoxin subunit/DMSO/TMAO reductase YedYZ heme-binding membrane subunit
MSAGYRAVQWTAHKKVYDLVLVGLIITYIAAFVAVGKLAWIGRHAISDEILMMRALGTCAIVMLHVVLCIGPLARIDRRFLPLLYNRRHLGVATFLLGLLHGLLAVGFYHGFGVMTPPVSLLANSTQYGSVAAFPFEVFGVVALLILFVMASTSHDFWLKNLGPGVWKAMHMMVYVAYALLVLHVGLGVMQSETSAVYPVLMGLGICIVTGLHWYAGRREVRRDSRGNDGVDWVDVGPAGQIPEGRAKVVCIKGGERVAVFRYDGKVSALSNVCAHQGGPIGEGKIIGGCATCPWHGYQYLPASGQSPPPFNEKIGTYRLKVVDGRVLIDPRELAAGTEVEPAVIEPPCGAKGEAEYVCSN